MKLRPLDSVKGGRTDPAAPDLVSVLIPDHAPCAQNFLGCPFPNVEQKFPQEQPPTERDMGVSTSASQLFRVPFKETLECSVQAQETQFEFAFFELP